MKDRKVIRTKHKSLDAICEREYSRSHCGVEESSGVGEFKDDGDGGEVRRSGRVRKAPVLLDTSPAPVKKRRRVGKGSGLSSVRNGEDGADMELDSSASRDVEEGDDGWRARLRSRSRGVGRHGREVEVPSPRGKRKLFDDCKVMVEESISVAGDVDSRETGVVGDETTVVKSKRPGRIKASNVPADQSQEIELGGSADDDKDESIERELLEERVQGGTLPTSEIECEVDKTNDDGHVPTPSVDIAKGEIQVDTQLEKCPGDNDRSNSEIVANVQLEVCQSLDKLGDDGQCKQDEIQACSVGEDRSNVVEINEPKSESDEDKGDADEPLETKTLEKLKRKHYHSDGQLRKFRIKEGRKCGLCGTSSDGKPPRKLVQDGAGSDNEAYSGSSSSEECNYDMLDGFDDEPGWLGRLLGPINDRHGIAGIWVHQQCAVWSPEVYFAGLGCLKNVRAALCRGRVLKCTHCGRSGATIGCRVDRCPRTYHLPCARANNCIFDHRKFLIACTDHRYMFQQGYQNVDYLKKMKIKKTKLELRKNSNDACRKDVEAEEKWLENCGEDEEFLKRESKRLHRDLLRIAPTYIGGSSDKQEAGCEGWESVAGLQSVIQCLKEVVILPLLYPEYFDNLGLTPPRGVLLHGYPGTGKTLVVRALIGSCARGDKKIAYFSRKGADCLGKYVGDAERQLRLLFQVAEKSQPSIIFFDEIDGLAPCRTPQQDQTHSSVVSTLLALMDGLKSRGSVIVIGATNRPDAVDPALRRPGRFDREIYFPLPSVDDREAILSLHTRNWPKPISGPLLKRIAGKTVGFAGADIQALCTQAAIIALRRSFPLQRILSAAADKAFNGQRPPLPPVVVQERDWLEAFACAAPPCSRREAGCAANELISSPLPAYLEPGLLQPLCRILISLHLDDRIWLPPPLSKAALCVENVIISALGKRKLNQNNLWSHATDVIEEAHTRSQIEDVLRNVGIIEGGTCSNSYTIQKDDISDGHSDIGLLRLQCARPGLLQNVAYDTRKKSGFRLLISGNPRSGQKHLASCLLHYFIGNVEVQKIDLATISQSGHGDMIQGLQQVLMRCASLHYCVIFMPRMDLWAMEIFNQKPQFPPTESESSPGISCNGCSGVDPEDSSPNSEVVNTVSKASYLWNSFVEQVQSISVNSSLTILATSEVQLSKLPPRIQQFFNVERINDKLLASMGNSVPQFSVEVDGIFEYERMFELCSARLSKDLAQHFAQVMHCENHLRSTSFSKDNVSNVDEPNVDGSNLVSHSVTETKQVPVATVSPTLRGNFSVKGKSSLLVAISTFGCQMLLYPHFAELCWVTSKLKEGPCANISGPWKGWPFNSCIVRPVESSERNNATFVNNTSKVDKKAGIVRGLIAVGLSAYRGEYTSLRQVASEVRKVLELLLGLIDAKIKAGKDRYEYTRVMSQVAYLEDMVLSWAHTLQRFEADVQPIEADLEISHRPSLKDESSIQSRPGDGNAALQDCTNELLHKSTVSEENQQKLNTNGDEGMGHSKTSVVDVLEADKEELVDLDNSLLGSCEESALGGLHLDHATEASKSHEDATESAPGASLVENNVPPENIVQNINAHSVLGGLHLGHATEASKSPEDATESAPDASLAENNILHEKILQNINADSVDSCRASGSTPIPQSDIICFYRCCAECLVNLHRHVKEILNQWQGTEKNSAIEDVHDFVSRVASKLHSAIRRLPVAEKPCLSSEDNSVACPELRASDCNDTTQPSMQCHNLSSDGVATGTKVSPCGLKLEFVFRNGVLTTSDTSYDASFHCKWESLCLCSLVELAKIA